MSRAGDGAGPRRGQDVGSTPAAFASYIKKEQARWKEVVEKAHIRAE